MITLPCISLWQPYASLLFVVGECRKVHETRGFKLPDRYLGERVAIHAAQRLQVTPELDAICIEAFGPNYRRELPRGEVVGSVHFDSWIVTDYVKPASEADRAAGDWTPGRYAWEASDPIKLEKSEPVRGRQSWFRVSVPDYLGGDQ